ncbi:MAG: hypothetical protein ACYTHJ_02445, partial [Planctomycetota bacterium]
QFNITVSGGGDGTGPGFGVEFGLYDGCPNDGGILLPGTGEFIQLPHDGLHTITKQHTGDPVELPENLWLAVEFDTATAGWFTGVVPEIGTSSDFYDFEVPGFYCSATLSDSIFASFASQLWCTPSPPQQASLPLPPDGSTDVDTTGLLMWNEPTTAGTIYEPAQPQLAGDLDCGTAHPSIGLQQLQHAVQTGEIPDPSERVLPAVAPRRPIVQNIAGGVPNVDRNDLFLYEDTNDLLVNGFSSGQLFNMMALATNDLLETHGDNYDFIGFFLNFWPDPGSQIGSAFYLGLENDVNGLGIGIFNNRSGFGVTGENVEGWVMMWNQAGWDTGELTRTQLVLGQEFEHRFGVFINGLSGRPLQGNNGSCGRSGHWHHRLDGQGSGMEMPEWVGDDPAVRFCPAPSGCRLNFNTDIPGGVFSYPDLYLMGYVSPSEMDAGASELRYLDDNSNCSSPYSGVISTWGSADIITANGGRVPNSMFAQKNFSTAWVMIHRPNAPPTGNELDRTASILNTWNDVFINSTLDRGTMTNVLNNDPCQEVYDVFLGTTDPPTNLVCEETFDPICEAGELATDTTYFWKVDTKKSAATLEGDVWTFTTEPCTAPPAPASPIPQESQPNVPLATTLAWNGGVPDGGPATCSVSYDVLFGTEPSPTAVLCDDIVDESCFTGPLDYNMTYYWQIISSTPAGDTMGPVWSFATESCAAPPAASDPDPVDLAADVSLSGNLSWNGGSAGGPSCTTSFDVRLDTVNPPVQTQCENLSQPGCLTGFLEPVNTYYWQVVSRSPLGTTVGPIWSFQTQQCPLPVLPTAPQPANGTTDAAIFTTLSWGGANVDVTLITFVEVAFGIPIDGVTIADVTFGSTTSDATVGGGPGTTAYIDEPNIEGGITETISMEFAIPVYAMSYGFALSSFEPQPNASTLTMFDDQMNVIGSVSVDAADAGFSTAEGLVEAASGVPIAYAEVTFDHPVATRFALDNVMYDPSPEAIASELRNYLPAGQDDQPDSMPDATEWIMETSEFGAKPDSSVPYSQLAANAVLSTDHRSLATREIPTELVDGGIVVFQDDMESGPGEWTHELISSGGGILDRWALSTSRSASGSNAWYSGPSEPSFGDTALVSPTIDISGASLASLQFAHWYHFDDCDDADFEPDGAIVEVRGVLPPTDWTQVFPSNGYPNTIGVVCSNPLESFMAYAHDSANSFLDANFDLTPFAGSIIQIRFHVGWDCGNCAIEEGWYIDDVLVVADNFGSCANSHDVYFSMGSPPGTLVCQDTLVRSCPVGPLNLNQQYFWRVVSQSPGGETEGQIWTFITTCPIGDSDPQPCSIDARQPHQPDSVDPAQGVNTITLAFDCDDGSTVAESADDFIVESSAGAAPGIENFGVVEDSILLILDSPIPPNAWTCIIHTPGQTSVCIGYLPGDVDGNERAEPADILRMIECLDGSFPCTLGSSDIDRNGLAEPSDLLRLIDLLNGGQEFDTQFDVAIGPCEK